jgi:tetratricopeptide (TPR) repeat protein
MEKSALELIEIFPDFTNNQNSSIKTKDFPFKIKHDFYIDENKFHQISLKNQQTLDSVIQNTFLYKYVINNLISLVSIDDITNKELYLKTSGTTIFKVKYNNKNYFFIIEDKFSHNFSDLISSDTINQYISNCTIINKIFVFDKNGVVGYMCELPKGYFLTMKIRDLDINLRISIARRLIGKIANENKYSVNFDIENIYIFDEDSTHDLIFLRNISPFKNDNCDFLFPIKRAVMIVIGCVLLQSENSADSLLINTEEELIQYSKRLYDINPEEENNEIREFIKDIIRNVLSAKSMKDLICELDRINCVLYKIVNDVQSIATINSPFPNNKDQKIYKYSNTYLVKESSFLEIISNKTETSRFFISEALRLQREGEQFYNQNDFSKAKELYEECLNIQKKLLGDEDKETGIAYNNLAGVFLKLREYQKALEFYQKSLVIYELHFGIEHQLNASVLNNIGLIYDIIGEYENALLYYQRSLTIKLNTLGENNCFTASSYYNIGGIYDLLGNYEISLKYYSKALEIYNSIYGENNADSATTYNNLGLVYDKLGKEDESISSYRNCIRISILILDENHPLSATALNNLGLVLFKKGEIDQAIVNFESSIKIRIKLFGTDHPDTASSYNNLAGALFKKEMYQEALEKFTKCLEINLKIIGEINLDTASAYNNIGLTYVRLNNNESALMNFKKCLKIRQIILKDAHPDLVSTLNNIGGVFYKMKLFNEAIEIYQKTLEMMVQIVGENHSELINIYKNLGNCYLNNCEIEYSLIHNEKALSLAQANYGQFHIKTSDCYFSLGIVYEYIMETDSSIECYEKSYEIRKKLIGDDHYYTKLASEKVKKMNHTEII